jgi:hypothetical protein
VTTLQLPSPALVIAVLALVLGFTGGAVAASRITGKQIKDGSITGKDIRNDSLTGTDIKGRVGGPAGRRGPAGPAGPPGPAASGGGSGPVTYRSQSAPVQPGFDTASASCPDGMVPTGGGAFALSDAVTVEWGRPIGLRTETPDSWEVRTSNSSDQPGSILVTAVCVSAPGSVTDDSPR